MTDTLVGLCSGDEEMELSFVSGEGARRRRDILLSHTHGRYHSEKCTDGKWYVGEALEEVQNGDTLYTNLIIKGVA